MGDLEGQAQVFGQAPPRLSFRLPLDPARLLRARERMRDYLHERGLRRVAIDESVLAIEEAMTNAVRHSGAHELEVDLKVEEGELVACVRDRGAGFDVDAFDRTRLPDPLATGGRGLYLIARLVDEMELHRNGGIEVRMRKRVPESVERHRHHEGVLTGGAPKDGAYLDRRQRTLIEEMAEVFATFDWAYRLTYANKTALTFFGLRLEEVLGTTFWEIFPAMRHTAMGEAVRQAMELGHSAIEEYLSPRTGRWVESRVYPTSSGLSIYLRDIDERKRRELAQEDDRRRAELLAYTADRLLSSDDPQRIVDDLCRRVMESLGCHVFFNFLVDDELGCLRLNAFAGIDEAEAQRIQLLDYGVAVCGCAARDRRRLIAEDIQHSDDERADLVRSYGVRAYCAHPLIVRERLIGTLSFGARDRDAFSEQELSLMQTVAGQVAIAIDRQQTERHLRESEERHRLLFEGMLGGYAYCRMLYENGRPSDFVYLAVNHAFETLTGLRDVVGRKVSEVIPGIRRDNPELLEIYGRVAAGGSPESFETYVPALDSWFSVSVYRPAQDHFVTVFDNISERKRAEKALRESEERFRIALHNAPVSVAAQDQDLVYSWAYNQKTAPYGGIVGLRDEDIFTPEEVRHITPIKRRVMEEGVVLREQLWLDRPLGRRHYDITWEPLRDVDGNVIGVTSATVDVTEWKLAEERVQLQGEELAAQTEELRRQTAELQGTQRRLRRELARSLLLQDVARAASRGLDLLTIGDATLGALRERLELKGGDIRLLQDGQLRLLSSFNYPPENVEVLRQVDVETSALLGAAAVRERRMFTHEDEVITPERTAILERQGIDQDRYAYIPIAHHDEIVGLLALVFDGRRAFGDDELTLFDAIAQVLGQAIANARLLERDQEAE